jgi:hypothetical protein
VSVWAGWGGGDYERARELLDRAQAIARRQQDAELELRVLATWTDVAGHALCAQDTADKTSEALRLLESVDSPWDESLVRRSAVGVHVNEGNLQEARVQAAATLAAAQRVRDRVQLCLAYMWNQLVAHIAGDWAGSREFSDEALASHPGYPLPLSGRAQLEAELGNFEEASMYLDRLLDLAEPEETGSAAALLALTVPVVGRIVRDTPTCSAPQGPLPRVSWRRRPRCSKQPVESASPSWRWKKVMSRGRQSSILHSRPCCGDTPCWRVLQRRRRGFLVWLPMGPDCLGRPRLTSGRPSPSARKQATDPGWPGRAVTTRICSLSLMLLGIARKRCLCSMKAWKSPVTWACGP